MKVVKIELMNYRGLHETVLDNLDPHLNLFIGVNGAGKSSLIDAITALLSGFTKRMLSNTTNNNPIAPKDVNNECRTGCKIRLTVEYDTTGTRTVDWIFGRTNKQLKDKDIKSETTKLNALVKEYRSLIDDNKNACIPIVVQYGVRRSVTDIPLKISHKQNVLQSETYIDSLDCAASFRQFFQWYRNEEDYENELKRDNPEYENRGLAAIRKALEIVLPEYSDLRVRRKPTQGLYMHKNGKEYRIEQLSDGEKCYIALVCDIVRRLTLANPVGNILSGEGIVLIDEVDLHLHPHWEAEIMNRLHETFPNLQFIVTAHSPLVASNFDGNVYTVKDGVYRKLPRIFGLDYSTILQDFMETFPGNKKLQMLADMYLAYKTNGMSSEADIVWQQIMATCNNDVRIPFIETLKSHTPQ